MDDRDVRGGWESMVSIEGRGWPRESGWVRRDDVADGAGEYGLDGTARTVGTSLSVSSKSCEVASDSRKVVLAVEEAEAVRSDFASVVGVGGWEDFGCLFFLNRPKNGIQCDRGGGGG